MPSNFLFKIIIIIAVIPATVYGFQKIFESWFKLSQVYETEVSPPNIFFRDQRGILGNTRINKKLNVGITKQALYLKLTYSYGGYIKPLLIDLKDITKIEPYFNDTSEQNYIMFIGDPHITTLVLSQELVEKLEQEYGEPIFSNKLGELN